MELPSPATLIKFLIPDSMTRLLESTRVAEVRAENELLVKELPSPATKSKDSVYLELRWGRIESGILCEEVWRVP